MNVSELSRILVNSHAVAYNHILLLNLLSETKRTACILYDYKQNISLGGKMLEKFDQYQ